MPGFLLSALHALSRCFSRSHPWITWFKSIRGANGKWRFLGSIIDLQHQHLMVGVEDLPSVILMHVNFKGHCIISYCTRDATAIFFPSTPPISVLKCLWRKEEKKILWTVRHGAMYAFLLAAGDYKCFSIAKLLLRHQVCSSTAVGLNNWEIFSCLLVAVLWI